MIEQTQIKELAQQIAAELNVVPFDEQIFTAQEAADYLRVKKNYLMNTLRSQPDFPKPAVYASEKRMSHPKWFAADLRDWMRKNVQ